MKLKADFSHAFCELNNDDDHIHFAMIFRAKKEVRLDPFTCTFKKKIAEGSINAEILYLFCQLHAKNL